ncbi:LexA family transcriptional regulator, partial [uncultured Dubosiella sp.]
INLTPDDLLKLMDDTRVSLSDQSTNPPSLFTSGIKNIFPVPEMHKIPLIGTIACGKPIYADQEYGYIETSIKADFCLRAQGDSMTGARIRNGDIVYCLAQPEVQNGEIAAVIIDDEATLKRFYSYGDTIVLHPENPDFPDLTYHGEEMANVRILGKAIEFRGKVR